MNEQPETEAPDVVLLRRIARRLARIEARLDLAEDKLLMNMKDRDDTALIVFLKCKGKPRGYVERSALELSGSVDLSGMSDEELGAKIDQLLARPRRSICCSSRAAPMC